MTLEDFMEELETKAIYEHEKQPKSSVHPLAPGNVVTATDGSMYGITSCNISHHINELRTERMLGHPMHYKPRDKYVLELYFIKTQEGKQLTNQMIQENPFMREVYKDGYQTAQKVTVRNYELQIMEMRNKIIELEKQLKPLKHTFKGFNLRR